MVRKTKRYNRKTKRHNRKTKRHNKKGGTKNPAQKKTNNRAPRTPTIKKHRRPLTPHERSPVTPMHQARGLFNNSNRSPIVTPGTYNRMIEKYTSSAAENSAPTVNANHPSVYNHSKPLAGPALLLKQHKQNQEEQKKAATKRLNYNNASTEPYSNNNYN